MADCCQSSLPSLSWNHAQHLTNRFGKFAVKACGARMWQNSLFTLNVNDETTVYTAATVLSWPCLMFQSRDLSTCMFYFCLLILRCILFHFHFSKHLENNPCLHPVAQHRVSGEAKHSASKSNNGTSSETKQHMSSSHTYGDVSDQTLLQSGHCLPNDSIPTQAVANHTCPGPTVCCLVVTSRRRKIRKQLHIFWITLLYQWCF